MKLSVWKIYCAKKEMASSPSPQNHRKNMDVAKLISSTHEVTVLNELDDFVVKFHGPKDTPYEGGVWNVKVHVHESYPYRPPTIRFINTVYHPNIQEDYGIVCLDVIDEEWTEKYDLMHIFDYFLPQLFALPEPSDPYNIKAANLLIASPEIYKVKVKEYIQKYATEEALADWQAMQAWSHAQEGHTLEPNPSQDTLTLNFWSDYPRSSFNMQSQNITKIASKYI